MNTDYINVIYTDNIKDYWEPDEWDDYSYEGPIFVIKRMADGLVSII